MCFVYKIVYNLCLAVVKTVCAFSILHIFQVLLLGFTYEKHFKARPTQKRVVRH